ncbi:MAG: DUF3617 domain-containing protein [Erythrobacter sp.]|uniref:DUF3617 domain-containing protein n=1 Tax=Erythrobacter sp. HL-111 TaxID=1798193 RepID=UPI0006DBA5E6|nr:DUF3617 domain-containing protein [Erythrobacter sp. HL-111]KPP88256.1 MAG: Protein of unknown function (DUF3617) [Erythrobacteraceae bacterium HL-111]SDS26928.1 Protein of unknown function [Erythrobacter sp. HL-111]
MIRAGLAAAACALLAACGGANEEAGEPASEADDGGAISSEEVLERARAGTVRPLPGLYRSEVELVDVDIPGAPPEATEMMRGQMAQSNEFCLTEEDVEEGYRRMASEPQGDNCSFTKFDVDGGEIDAAMTCSDPDGGSMNITMQGTGGETSSEFMMRMAGNFGGSGEGSMTMKQSSERIGDCPED